MEDCPTSPLESNDLDISRRGLAMGALAGMAVLLATSAGTSAAAQAGPSARKSGRRTLDFENSAKDNLYAYAKMIGDLSGKPAAGTLKGHILGIVPGEGLRPLFGMWGWGTGRTHMRDDGKVEVTWREVAVYTDLETGKIMDKWRNPYSGELVDVMPVQNDPVNFLLGEEQPLSNMGQAGLERQFTPGNYGHPGKFIFPWDIDRKRDYASIFYEVSGYRKNPLDPKVWPRESSGPFIRVTESFQYGAKLSALENPKLTTVPYVGGWQRIASWLPWMVMDQRPGDLFYRSVTRNLDSLDDLDPELLAYAKANFPHFLIPPDKFTMENVGSFDVYKAKRKPLPPLQK